MFDVDFPKDTTSVKFRAVQWICTEVLLAMAALLNFMPRMCLTLGLVSTSLTPRSQAFQMGVLYLIQYGHAGLLLEPHLAPHWNPQHLGIPDRQ